MSREPLRGNVMSFPSRRRKYAGSGSTAIDFPEPGFEVLEVLARQAGVRVDRDQLRREVCPALDELATGLREEVEVVVEPGQGAARGEAGHRAELPCRLWPGAPDPGQPRPTDR